jgi:hypothetical protein
MPDDPTKPLNSIAIAGDLKAEGQRSGGEEEKKILSSDEIIPARGMIVNAKGQVVLTRYPTPNASQRNAPQSNYCSTSSTQEKLLATDTKDERAQETLDDRAVEELMDFLYSQKLK